MQEKKDDLTGLVEYSKKLKSGGESLTQSQVATTAHVSSLSPISGAQPQITTTITTTSESQVTEFQTAVELETQDPITNLREFADQVSIGKPNIEAADPFHLVIEGKLTLSEKGKIIDLIEKHKIGIEKKDLEFQLDSGRVLIPRISEYAGVLIVQALRSSQAVLKLSPVSEESNDISSVVRSSAKKATPEIQYVADELDHPAENIPITQNSSLPGFIPYEFIDQMIVTATIKTSVVEAMRSAEYQEVLEALTREMKYRAYRKDAQAILDFEISLTPLSSPDSYKLTLIGLAVRAPKKKK